jgi:RES domain
MAATDPLYLKPPDDEDLAVALSAWRDGRLQYELVPGSRWYRILRARSAEEALEFARACYPSDANNRFSPVRRSGTIVPAAYAGDRPETAAWEVVLRDIRHQGVRRIPEHETRDRYLTEARLLQPLLVVDIRRPQVENLIAAGKHSPRLSDAPDFLYDQTRHRAQKLVDHLPEMRGILYESYQVPGDCIIVFADEGMALFEPVGEAISVRDEPVRALLRREAARANTVVDFGDPAESVEGL